MPAYHVAKSIEIEASAERAWEIVADFGTWTSWSPWLCAEPEAKVTVQGPAGQVGSTYAWSGDVVGEGEIEQVELSRGEFIKNEIRFVRPFRSVSQVGFQFETLQDDKARVTWSMSGKLPWFLFWMKNTMTRMIGMDYERGLRMLKEFVETGSIRSTTEIRGIEQVGPIHVVGTRAQCAMADIGATMEKAFSEAKQQVTAAGMNCQSTAVTVYHKVDLKRETFDFTSGFTVPELKTADNLSTWSLPACPAFAVGHRGSYNHLGNAWSAAYQHVRYKKLKLGTQGTFEMYRNDPQEVDPAELLTDIYLPVR